MMKMEKFNEELMENCSNSSPPYILGSSHIASKTRLVILTLHSTPPVFIIRQTPITHATPHGDPIVPTTWSCISTVWCYNSSSRRTMVWCLWFYDDFLWFLWLKHFHVLPTPLFCLCFFLKITNAFIITCPCSAAHEFTFVFFIHSWLRFCGLWFIHFDHFFSL